MLPNRGLVQTGKKLASAVEVDVGRRGGLKAALDLNFWLKPLEGNGSGLFPPRQYIIPLVISVSNVMITCQKEVFVVHKRSVLSATFCCHR